MNHLLKKLLAPRQTEYVILNENLIVVEASLGLKRFADRPRKVALGKDIRLGFPEFIGVEEVLQAVLHQQRSNFEIKGIARGSETSSPLYIDLYVYDYQDETTLAQELLVLFEDVTEKMVMRQNLLHRANEANLLLSALAASKDYIDKIITSIADALLVTTASGTIKTVNRAAQLLFGYSELEFINQPLSLVVLDGELLQQSRQVPLLYQGEPLQEIEVCCRTKKGEEIVVGFSCSAIQTDIEGLYNFVYIGRNVTARKLEETEIRTALAKEKEMRQLKSRFFSMVSHEFSSPINTVLFSAALLKQYGNHITDEENRQYLQHIQTAARHMIELLNELRFIGCAEAGQLDFNPVPLDLEKFCLDLVDEIKLGSGSKHQIQFDYSESPTSKNGGVKDEELFQIDSKLLRQILSNLLLNAIKYSPQGSTIYLELICHEREVIFKIRDEGMGIPLKDQQQLFEAFYRASNVGKIPGTGLGLAIVKQSVDLHGGNIDFTSEVGVGTTFTVTIPLTKNVLALSSGTIS